MVILIARSPAGSVILRLGVPEMSDRSLLAKRREELKLNRLAASSASTRRPSAHLALRGWWLNQHSTPLAMRGTRQQHVAVQAVRGRRPVACRFRKRVASPAICRRTGSTCASSGSVDTETDSAAIGRLLGLRSGTATQ